MRLVLPLLFLLASCKTLDSGYKILQTYENELSIDDVFVVDGASNSRGAGSSFTMEDRFVYHLLNSKSDLLQQLHKDNKRMFLSVDYFFPSNFTTYLDPSVTSRIEAEVESSVNKLLHLYDKVVLVNLFNADDLTYAPLKEFLMTNKANSGLYNIHGFLGGNAKAKEHLRIVNGKLKAMSEANPNLIIIDFTQTWARPILTQAFNETGDPSMGGMKINPTFDGRLGSYTNVPLLDKGQPISSLFDSDRLHVNDAGQASVFNAIFADLTKRAAIGDAVVEPLPLTPKLSAAQVTTINKFFAKQPTDFAAGRIGRYKFGPVDMAEFTSGRAKFHLGSKPNQQTYPANELRAIRDLVNVVAKKVTTAETLDVRIKNSVNAKVMNIDLTKALNYGKIDLTDDGKGNFIGYGSDYWTSASLYKIITGVDPIDHIPAVYYYFIARINGTHIDLTWYIIPSFGFKPGEAGYPSTKERLTSLEDPALIKKLEDVINGALPSQPYLMYKLRFSAR